MTRHCAPGSVPDGERLEFLLESLRSEDRHRQRTACSRALPRLRRERPLRDALREELRGPSAQGRFAAAWLLFRAERPSLRLLPALLEALELADGDRRWEAAQMLAHLGRLQGEVARVLEQRAREHAVPLGRRMALYALRELAPEAGSTQRVLWSALDDPDLAIRRAALASCPKLLEPDPGWLDRAVGLLERERDPGLRALVPLVLAHLAGVHPELHARIDGVLGELERGEDGALARSARLAHRRLAARQPTPPNQE